VLARAEQVFTEPRAAPHHLPELCFRTNRLEEDEIQYLRHVDAGVEHIHRDCNVRSFGLLRKIVDQGLRVGTGLVGDEARQPCPESPRSASVRRAEEE
jgi:hypothetical protein